MFSAAYRTAKASPFARGFGQGVKETLGWQYAKKGISEGFLGWRGQGGLKANFLGNAFGLAFTALSAYQGYQENGLSGAASNVASEAIMWGVARGAWRTAAAIGASGLTTGAGIALGAGYGYYKLGEAGRRRARRYRNLELGSDVTDTFGTMATMRQRSLSAIQNSHINGRLALGGEASLMHNPILR